MQKFAGLEPRRQLPVVVGSMMFCILHIVKSISHPVPHYQKILDPEATFSSLENDLL